MSIKVDAVQAHDIQGDVPASLRVVIEAMRRADNANVDVLCFPECFLQGYTLDDKDI